MARIENHKYSIEVIAELAIIQFYIQLYFREPGEKK